MSKKYKGKQCVYCVSATSATGDHVIGREFFLPNQRSGLPIVPACEPCNNRKSQLEHYLMAVLPFGGLHPDAASNLETLVRKRLLKNAKLHAELVKGLAQSGGTAIPFDSDRLTSLCALIARGLLWYHWGILLGEGFSAMASLFADSSRAFFESMISQWATPNRVEVDLGNRTFTYKGVQPANCPQMSIWNFSMYGGVAFAHDPKAPGSASLAVAVTGPNEIIRRLETGI